MKKFQTFFHKKREQIGLAVCPCLLLTLFIPGLSLDTWMESDLYQDMARQVLALVNREREEQAIPPLGPSNALSILACNHAREIAAWNTVTHLSPASELRPLERIGYSFPNIHFFGENVARARTVERLHEILMDSPEHRENILRPDFTKIGIGIAVDRPGVLYLVQDFIGSNPGETRPEAHEPYFKADPEKVRRVVRMLFPVEQSPLTEVTTEIMRYTVPVSKDEKLIKEGIKLAEKGQFDGAIERFQKVLDQRPRNRDARYNLALTLQKKGQFKEAFRILMALYEQDHSDMESLYSIGRHYYVYGDFEEAENTFETLIQETSRDDHPLLLIYAHQGLARIAELQGRRSEAEKHYREILQLGEEKGIKHPIIKRTRKKIMNKEGVKP